MRAKFTLLVAVLLFSPAAHCDSIYPFKVESIKDDNQYRIVVRNTGRAPVDVTVALTMVDNIGSDQEWPLRRVVRAGEILELARVYGADRSRGYSFNYQTHWLFGDPQARPDPNATYRLPFANGLSLVIGQAPGGPLVTHNSPDALYAVDIPMPEGTPIVAARSGYVIDNVRPFDTGKLDPAFLDKANYVCILHDDGTWADYAHLTHYSANLYVGTRIEAGTVIGLSGSSGYSSGPHLHFVVQKNEAGHVVSIPFRFYTVAKGAFSPAPDQHVTADYGAPSPAMPKTAGAGAGGVGETKRSARLCMGTNNVIDEAVVRCMNGQ
jgi:murein DD-endopeptidase MepM/ murein hydrolase activator NlpD